MFCRHRYVINRAFLLQRDSDFSGTDDEESSLADSAFVAGQQYRTAAHHKYSGSGVEFDRLSARLEKEMGLGTDNESLTSLKVTATPCTATSLLDVLHLCCSVAVCCCQQHSHGSALANVCTHALANLPKSAWPIGTDCRQAAWRRIQTIPQCTTRPPSTRRTWKRGPSLGQTATTRGRMMMTTSGVANSSAA